MAILGIDLGTSSVKVIVLDTQGQTLSVSKADYEVMSLLPGWAEINPSEWWHATISAVQGAVAQAPHASITAVGLSGQMHGVVPTDEQGQPTRVALLWADTRAEAELKRYRALPPSLLPRLANPLVPGMAGPLLCWLVDHWADDVIVALGLKRDLFAPLIPSGALAGTLSARAAKAFGLSPGLPVATGAGDTAAAALGTGLLAPGSIQLSLGTGAQLVQLCSEPRADPTGRTHLYRAADGVNWYTMAAVQNAGLALDWVRRTLGASWDELYESADIVAPGAAGLTFLPYLTRERAHHRNPHSSGAFLGMRIDHQREHLLHAALEGVAFGIRIALEALPGAK